MSQRNGRDCPARFAAVLVAACGLLVPDAVRATDRPDWGRIEAGLTRVDPRSDAPRAMRLSAPSAVAGDAPGSGASVDRLGQAWSARWEFGGLLAGITTFGVLNWNWGNSHFRFQSEGWFNEKRTGSGGMDKLGHAYSTYVMTDILTHAIRRNASDSRGAEVTAALMAYALMTYVEVFDGYSGDHGFAYEDMVMNAAGAAFSVLRNTVPGLREKLDFRMQYLTSAHSGFRPFIDYEGQKFVLALKLAGFEGLRETPLRYLEVHAGYYARGYTRDLRRAGADQEQHLYVGLGLNVQELLFGSGPYKDHWLPQTGRTMLEYVQLPYTYVSSDGNSGR